MRIKFEIKDSLKWKPDFTIEIQDSKWEKWYNENSKRFFELQSIKADYDRVISIAEIPIFDVDESIWLRIMSHDHFREMDKFLFGKK